MYKPSYAEIRSEPVVTVDPTDQQYSRGSADAAQLLANDFHNCGSGYTYTATSGTEYRVQKLVLV